MKLHILIIRAVRFKSVVKPMHLADRLKSAGNNAAINALGIFFTIAIALTTPLKLHAEPDRSQVSLGGGYAYFKGNTPTTLAGDAGYLVRFQGEMGRNSLFRVFGNFTGTYAKGSSTFSDAGANTNLSYLLLAGEVNVGVMIAPLVYLKRSFVQPYIGGFGSGMLTSFKFTGTVPATFPKVETSLYYGFGYQTGVDFYITKSNGLKICFEQNIVSGKLDGSTFKLGSLRFMISWLMY